MTPPRPAHGTDTGTPAAGTDTGAPAPRTDTGPAVAPSATAAGDGPRPRRFAVWAPEARGVDLVLDGTPHPLHPADPDGPDAPPPEPGAPHRREGWWTAVVPAAPGDDYGFRLDGGPVLPDPRGARLPHGPDGPTRLVDHAAFDWRAAGEPDPATPPRRPVLGGLLYELHVGTFTPEGTFDAAAARLTHLADLGVDTVSLMPVCAFPGRHGWGYDGVAPWSVHEPYGGPDGLKRFVAAAHRHGLGVVLDVVHNHLGPSGNHLPAFGPYFTDLHRTPWGSAVNLDGAGSDEVRAHLIGSALAWLRDYHVDGLRLDAVHALIDTRAPHFLEELAAAVDALAAAEHRPLTLIAESDLNDPRLTAPRADGGQGVHAQWNDEFHHALHAVLAGESQGYYGDFAGRPPSPATDPLDALAAVLARVWLHDGTWSTFRGRSHGRPVDTARTSGHRFLGYLQTHDQIGNRAAGDRLAALVPADRLAAGAALVLTAPFTPMLFMGEEWGARTPWQYFTDHPDPELGRAVSEGRRREFGAHGWAATDVPDPQDPATRRRSVLDWAEPAGEPHSALLEWYRRLIALRRAEPALAGGDLTGVGTAHDAEQEWFVLRRGPFRTVVTLADGPRRPRLDAPGGVVALAAWPSGAAPGDPRSTVVLRAR